MLKNLLLLTLVIFISSCMATFQLDGKPIPDHVYTQTNPRTLIKANFVFTRYIEKSEGKEKFLYPDYLELNKDIVIPNDTKSIYITLELINIRKVSYTLVKKYTVWDGSLYPQKITQTVSISKQSNRIHQFKLPYEKNIKVVFSLQLYDSKGNFIMSMGQAKYIVEGGDTG